MHSSRQQASGCAAGQPGMARSLRHDASGVAMPRHKPPVVTADEELLEEVIDTSLQPDRAHHDELGRTANGIAERESSPREQPSEPIDLGTVDE